MSAVKKRRSILKDQVGGDETKNISHKKLSFYEPKEDVEDKEGEETGFGGKIFLAPNLKLTKIGVCYIPPSKNSSILATSIIPKQQNHQLVRPDYRLLFKEDFDSASVLIIGEQVLCDGFQVELENTEDKFPSPMKLICKNAVNPTYEEIAEADFFIFLLQLNKYYNIPETRSRVIEVRRHLKCLSFRSLFVCVSSSVGPYDDVIPPEDYHNLFVEFQIPSFTFCVINRERKSYVMESIYSTIINSCSGNSSDPLIRWGLSCPTESQDTLLT